MYLSDYVTNLNKIGLKVSSGVFSIGIKRKFDSWTLEKIDQNHMMVYWWFSAGNPKVLVLKTRTLDQWSFGFLWKVMVFVWFFTKNHHKIITFPTYGLIWFWSISSSGIKNLLFCGQSYVSTFLEHRVAIFWCEEMVEISSSVVLFLFLVCCYFIDISCISKIFQIFYWKQGKWTRWTF